jgi:hypothetical protein
LNSNASRRFLPLTAEHKKTPAWKPGFSRYTEPYCNDYFAPPAVLLEAGVLLDFLWDFLVDVEEDDEDLAALWCFAVDVDDAGAAEEEAADWAKTEPERATPATSREAIASLRIMIMSLEIFECHGPGRNPANSGGVTVATMHGSRHTATEQNSEKKLNWLQIKQAVD